MVLKGKQVVFSILLLACTLSRVSSQPAMQPQGQNPIHSLTQMPSPGLGFVGLNCGRGPNATVFISCQRDCEENHNARYGFCGNAAENDFSCYCSRPLKTVQTKSRQCVDRRSRKHYDAICRSDCLCDHGALDFRCNYKTHTCECLGQSLNMKLCPHKNLNDLIQFVIGKRLPGFPKAFDGTRFTS